MGRVVAHVEIVPPAPTAAEISGNSDLSDYAPVGTTARHCVDVVDVGVLGRRDGKEQGLTVGVFVRERLVKSPGRLGHMDPSHLPNGRGVGQPSHVPYDGTEIDVRPPRVRTETR